MLYRRYVLVLLTSILVFVSGCSNNKRVQSLEFEEVEMRVLCGSQKGDYKVIFKDVPDKVHFLSEIKEFEKKFIAGKEYDILVRKLKFDSGRVEYIYLKSTSVRSCS